jgi:23S rRNA pseudouridine1911/1915/1917 synthase
MTRKFSASVVDAGARLGAWLAQRLDIGVGEAARLVAVGAVHVDGRRERAADRVLHGGEKIAVHEPAASPSGPSGAWRVVHEEPEIIVVEKPAGLAVVPGRAGGAALATEVAAAFPGATAFHRIDEGTSGLVLFARASGSARLAAALAAGALEREYRAVVSGSPPDEMTIAAPIGADPRDRRRMAVGVPGARPARTDVTALRRGASRTLVSARLSTGRTHQIRVHLSSVGHPVVGDPRYGGEPAARLALHAIALSWPGGPRIVVALPEELSAMVDAPP